jgi:Beta-propeller repeat
MLRPVEGLIFPSRVGIVSPQGRYSELVSVYLVRFSLWFHAGFPYRLGIPGALCGRYSTFLGGTSFEQGLGIAVDGEGRAYVTGSTLSTDFPITPGAFDTSFDGGDAFVTKLRTDWAALRPSVRMQQGRRVSSRGACLLEERRTLAACRCL